MPARKALIRLSAKLAPPERPGMSSEIITEQRGDTGFITLNRPKALHALSHAMCLDIAATLLDWREEDAVRQIVLRHAPETRGFCAGGDVTAVRRALLAGDAQASRDFFLAEYRLNHLLHTYPKRTIAFMDGVTMGGGVGLALPCDIRIATEHTLFAMPEGAIGLFPDIGAGWYLPRLPKQTSGQIGKFLALTGARLDGAECVWAGLATHYIPADRLEDAQQQLGQPRADPATICNALAIDAPPARLATNAEKIDRLFASDTLDNILVALADDPGKWAAKELQAVSAKCPTSAKVALRLLATSGQQPDFAAEMQREYAIMARMLERTDFAKGVRAVLVDKDNAPQWHPPTAQLVTEAMLDDIFAPLPDDERWTPLGAT